MNSAKLFPGDFRARWLCWFLYGWYIQTGGVWTSDTWNKWPAFPKVLNAKCSGEPEACGSDNSDPRELHIYSSGVLEMGKSPCWVESGELVKRLLRQWGWYPLLQEDAVTEAATGSSLRLTPICLEVLRKKERCSLTAPALPKEKGNTEHLW